MHGSGFRWRAARVRLSETILRTVKSLGLFPAEERSALIWREERALRGRQPHSP